MDKKSKARASGKNGKGTAVRLSGVKEALRAMEEKARSLEMSERKYRALFEDTKDSIIITTADRIIIDANAAASELWGYDRAEMMGMFSGDLFVQTEELVQARKLLQKQGFGKDIMVHKSWRAVLFPLRHAPLVQRQPHLAAQFLIL